MARKIHATAALVDDEGRPTRVFFVLLNDLIDAVEVTIPAMQAEIDGLKVDLDALEALVESHHP